MLSLEAGGADIIELGVPFSDPIADGPVIQRANTVNRSIGTQSGRNLSQIAIENGVHYADCLEYIREARKQGLKAPVVLMGKSDRLRADLKLISQVTTTPSSPTAKRRLSRMPTTLAQTATLWLTFHLRKL